MGRQSVSPSVFVFHVGGILFAQRVAVLAAADSYAGQDGSACHRVVVSFVNSGGRDRA